MSEIEKARHELENERNELDEKRRMLSEEMERITMVLESNNQLDTLMGSLIRTLRNYPGECTLVHSLTAEEAEALAEPIIQNLSDLVYMIRGRSAGPEYDYSPAEAGDGQYEDDEESSA